MNYTAEGKIIYAMKQSGVSAAGRAWEKMAYVLETFEDEPCQIPFTVFGQKCEELTLKTGDSVRLVFSISGREYQGKWYTDISGVSATPLKKTRTAPVPDDRDSLPF